jgi:hypothetical protein
MWRDKLYVKKLVLKGWAPCTPKNMCWEHVPGSGKSSPRCLASVGRGGGLWELVLCSWIMYEKRYYLWQSNFAFIIQWDLAFCPTNLSFLLLVPGSHHMLVMMANNCKSFLYSCKGSKSLGINPAAWNLWSFPD